MYRYYKEENVIKEVASVGMPDVAYESLSLFGQLYNYYFVKWQDYNKHIASLKSFDCHESCKELWEDGKEVSEGVDFEIKNIVDIMGVSDWLLDGFPAHKMIAYPLIKPETKDELWEGVFKIYTEVYFNEPFNSIEKLYEELKKHYSIKRITANELPKDRKHQ